MLQFLRRLFYRRSHNPDERVQESWSTKFGRFGKHRFESEQEYDYRSKLRRRSLDLTLQKKNLFAWTDNPYYRYDNFVIEADLTIPEDQGHSSTGFIFRKIDDSTFYYMLVSNRGRFRFDVVLNGNPTPLIAWTECEVDLPDVHLRIIARDDHFSFHIDEEWIGEIQDDSIDAGSIAFAAQNYDESDEIIASLTYFSITSVPIDVEAQFYRWTRYVPIDPDRRSRLAETFSRMGQYASAGVQLKRAAAERELTADEELMLAECRLNLGLHEPALEAVSRAIEKKPDFEEAIIEKANLLYLVNRFLELRTFLQQNEAHFQDKPGMWNLFGNCWYSLGNFGDAAECYEKAAEIQTDMPIFSMNAARARDMLGDTRDAVRDYTNAARMLFREEAYDDLRRILNRVRELDPENPEIRSIEGKVAFHEGNMDRAEELFEQVLEEGASDSSVDFMYGLICVGRDRRNEADIFFRRAVEKEPDFYLYHLRYAENRHMRGLSPDEELERARELAPDDPWVLNFSGLLDLERGNFAKAADCFGCALEKSDQDPEVLINYTEALFRLGEREKAIDLLKSREEPRCLNQLGTLSAEAGKVDEAMKAYRMAMTEDPASIEYKENYAAASIEASMVHEAEDTLRRILDSRPSARAYNMMGHIAREKGEYSRAESSYVQAIRLEPGDTDLHLNLADLYVMRRNYESAKAVLGGPLKEDHRERVERLRKTVREATETVDRCAECGREWWSPNEIETQPPLKLYGEPPRDSPAGKCPECGKIYCIECAQSHIRESRFYCPECNEFLKLSDDRLKYLVRKTIEDDKERNEHAG